jgi:hypothetical protein
MIIWGWGGVGIRHVVITFGSNLKYAKFSRKFGFRH